MVTDARHQRQTSPRTTTHSQQCVCLAAVQCFGDSFGHTHTPCLAGSGFFSDCSLLKQQHRKNVWGDFD